MFNIQWNYPTVQNTITQNAMLGESTELRMNKFSQYSLHHNDKSINKSHYVVGCLVTPKLENINELCSYFRYQSFNLHLSTPLVIW